MNIQFRLAIIVCVIGAGLGGGDRNATAQNELHFRPGSIYAPTRTDVIAEGCLVSVIDERKVPAKEAGTLAAMSAREGDEVRGFSQPRNGKSVGVVKLTATAEREIPTPLAIIDKEVAASQRDATKAARDAAVLDASNRVSIEHAESTQKVAELQLKLYEKANERVPNSIAELEVAKAAQEVETAKLRVRQAEHDFAKLALVAVEKEAELAIANKSLGRHDIYSPIDGIVVEVYAQEGEWVKPGDPVFRVVNLNRLRIQANLNIADCAPGDVAGQEVMVTSDSVGGGKETFKGRVTFVHPEIRAGGRFAVWAEVENRKDARGHYRLLPGMKTTLKIAAAKPE